MNTKTLIRLLMLCAIPAAQAASTSVQVSPGSLNYGNQLINTSRTLVVTVKNISGGYLTITGVRIPQNTNLIQSDFQQSNNCVTTLPNQAACQVSVIFTPSKAAAASANLTFSVAAYDIGQNIPPVPLSGTGTLPPPKLTFSTTSLGFGPTRITTNSPAQAITITNSGQSPAQFSSIAIADAIAGDFETATGGATPCHNATTLAVNASCAISVVFSPAATGGVSRVGTLTVTDNNNGIAGSVQSVSLSGTAQFGTPFVDAVTPASRTVASASAGFSLSLTGANLTKSSIVSINGTSLSTTKNASGLQATVPAGLITSAGSPTIHVTNPGAALSNSVLLPVPSAASTQPQFVAYAGSNLMALASGFNISTGDFNRDGLQDIVVCSPPLITIYLANGDGTYRVSQSIQPQAVAQFNPAQPSEPTVVAMLPYATALADFNGDGITDLAMMSYPNSVVIFRGVGDGTFAPMTLDMTTFLPRAYLVGNNPTFGVAGDFNRDGKVDVAVSAQDGTISILEGNGDGSLTLVNLIQGYGSGAIVAGDFNNDGILDLAAINTGANTVRILLGDGASGFSAGPVLPAGVAPQSLITADFNGDGFLDMAVTNSGSKFVTILLGSAGGKFTSASPVATPAAAQFAAAGDLNGDGHVDLVVANGTDGSFSVLLGTGTGSFVPASAPVKIGANMTAIYLIDSNHDGRLDLAVFDAGSNKITTLVSK